MLISPQAFECQVYGVPHSLQVHHLNSGEIKNLTSKDAYFLSYSFVRQLEAVEVSYGCSRNPKLS